MANSYIDDVYGYKLFCMSRLFDLKSTIYFGIGGISPWSSGANEVVRPVDLETTIDDVVALKLADEVAFAIPDDENGTVEHLGQKYAITTDINEAIAAKAHHMYYKAKFEYADMPVTTFRQIGLYVGVSIASGQTSSKGIYLPHQVSDYGDLIIVNNRAPIVRSSDQKEYIEFIIQI